MKDFFISYNNADRNWAEWIAWHLEEAGYSVVIQAWDFRPGSNFVLEMDKAAREAKRTIAVLSDDYLKAFTPLEWAVAFAKDPKGDNHTLVPVQVRKCKLEGLLKQIVYIKLYDLDEQTAVQELLAGVQPGRRKPTSAPVLQKVIDLKGSNEVAGTSEREPKPKDTGVESPDLREEVFISYAHANSRWLDKLLTFLKPDVQRDSIKLWSDRDIRPGEKWKEEITKALAKSKAAILLVSPEFLASDFIAKNELPPLLDAEKSRGLIILWIAISSSSYRRTAIGQYQAVNDPSKPLDLLSVPRQKQALVSICEKIVSLAGK